MSWSLCVVCRLLFVLFRCLLAFGGIVFFLVCRVMVDVSAFLFARLCFAFSVWFLVFVACCLVVACLLCLVCLVCGLRCVVC